MSRPCIAPPPRRSYSPPPMRLVLSDMDRTLVALFSTPTASTAATTIPVPATTESTK